MVDTGSGSLVQQLADAEAAAVSQASCSSGHTSRGSQVRDRFSEKEVSEVSEKVASEAGSGRSLPKDAAKNSHVSSARSFPSEPSSSLSGENALNLDDLKQKVKNLTQALSDRDSQQVVLLEKLANMEKSRSVTEAKNTAEHADARKALQASEDVQHGLADQVAGQHARQKIRDAKEDDRKALDEVTNEAFRVQAADDKQELNELQSLLSSARLGAVEEAALDKLKTSAHGADTEQFMETIASLMAELKSQKRAEDGPDENERMQQKIIDMHLHSQNQSKEMSELRLQMLGFKKENFKHGAALASKQKPLEHRSVTRQRQSTLSNLLSIDEENDEEDSFDSMSGIGFSASVSDCASSDAGDKEHSLNRARLGVVPQSQEDVVTSKPPMASAEHLRIEENLRVEHAEQVSMVTRLKDLLQEFRDSNDLLKDDMAFMKKGEALDAIASINKVDALQLKLRYAAERNEAQESSIAWQASAEGKMREDTEMMHAELCKTQEALRIALLRIKDLHAELENQHIRNEKELVILRQAGQVPLGSADLPEQRLQELQQDRSLLADQLQAQETQFRLERDETQLHHNAEILEIRRDYESRLLECFRERDHAKSLADTDLSSAADDTTGVPGSAADARQSADPSCRGEEQHASGKMEQSCLTGCFSKMNDAVWPFFSDPISAQSFSVQLSNPPFCWAKACWEVLDTTSSIAALSCTFPELEIVKVSKGALAQLGPHLHGMNILHVFPSQKQMMIRRAINIHQGLADESTKCNGFICRELGTFELQSPSSRMACTNVRVVMAHLPAEGASGAQRSLLVLLLPKASTQTSMLSLSTGSSGLRGGSSTDGSDILPGDSVSMQGGSVGRKRSQTQLRTSHV